MSQSLQILHIIAELDGYGTTGQMRLLVDHQKASGHQVRVVALAAVRKILKSWQAAGIDCRCLDRRWQFDLFSAWRLRRELTRRKYNLLHTWDPLAHYYCQSVRSSPVPQLILPRLAPGISPSPTPSISRDEFLAAQALPADAQLLAVAGRLTRKKHVDEAIWSFELVRTIHTNARLLIVGDGPDRHRLERFTRLTTDPSAVRFLGYRADWRSLLPHVDVFWHLAETPPAALEAMAARVPVVASAFPANRSLIEEEQTGFLAPWDQRALWARHTLRLLKDQQLAAKIGEASTAMVDERFSLDAMTTAYDQLYRNTLAQSTERVLAS